MRFVIGASTDEADHPSAIEREGPVSSVAFLFSLPDSDKRDLVFLGASTDDSAPELRLNDPTFALRSVQSLEELDSRKAGILQRVISSLRGSYGGVLMVGPGAGGHDRPRCRHHEELIPPLPCCRLLPHGDKPRRP